MKERVLRCLPISALLVGLGVAQRLRQTLGPLDLWASAHLPTLCPVRAATGLPCPTCGLGRGLLAAAGGDWAFAYAHHALSPALLTSALVLAVSCAVAPGWTGRRLRELARWPRHHPRLTLLLLATFLIHRIATIAPHVEIR